jgi:hypothetical protein
MHFENAYAIRIGSIGRNDKTLLVLVHPSKMYSHPAAGAMLLGRRFTKPINGYTNYDQDGPYFQAIPIF